MAKPEITFRHGPCSAAIFVNEYQRGSETFTMRSVTFQKQYKDANGQWQSINCLHVNDLPKAVLVLNRAYEYLTANPYVEKDG